MPTPERIEARNADLGDGMLVRRVLPTRQRRMVGAWCFLDHAGPVEFAQGHEMHVHAHPHTGLQTFTWLIEGEVLHRDSIGSEQVIRPGQVNLMTAGRGIVHTEDGLTPRLHAAQLWIALPPHMEDCAPAFQHHPELPQWSLEDCTFTLLAGEFAGQSAPTQVHTPLVGLDVLSTSARQLSLPLNPQFEYGLLPLEGQIQIDGEVFQTDEFAYLAPGASSLNLRVAANTRLLLIGGEPFAPPITMWWNFVGLHRAYVIQAQSDWEPGTGRFPKVKGEAEGPRMHAPKLPWTQHEAQRARR